MRIAFLDSWLASSVEGSGTAVSIAGLLQGLEARGHRVTRICRRGQNSDWLTIQRLAYNVNLCFDFDGDEYDLVVGFDIDGFMVSRVRNLKNYCVSVKGVLAEEARQEQGSARLALRSLSLLEGLNARQAPRVLTTSRYCRDALKSHYGIDEQKISIVPEGFDLGYWRKIIADTPRTSDGNTVLCIARQYRRKRVCDLLHAMAIVRRTLPRARAVIIGDGPEHSRLRHLAAELDLRDSVVLMGPIADHVQLARAYRQADAFCLPSIQEGFGIVFLEAMVNGLPIVSTRAAAIPEVVGPRNGILVKPLDVDALAQAITMLLKNADLRREYGEYNQAHVERYDWSEIALAFERAVI